MSWRAGLTRAAFAGLQLLAGASPAAAGQTAVVTTEHVQARLQWHTSHVARPEGASWLGLAIAHQPGWHTYWLNPGDSGAATTLDWRLPTGMVAGGITWPAPQRLPAGPLVNQGYEGRLLLPVPVQMAQAPSASDTIRLHAEWLVCKVICVPESADLVLPWSEAERPLPPDEADRFDAVLANLPQLVPDQHVQAYVQGSELLVDATGMPAAWQRSAPLAFAEQGGVVEPSGTVRSSWQDGRLRLGLPLAAQQAEHPASMNLVLVAADQQPLRLSFAVAWPRPASEAKASPAPASDGTRAAAPDWQWQWLFAAALGGFLLNLMPCVFPVLALKVAGFAASRTPRERAFGAAAYATGVVLSFLALGTALLALRAAGTQLGWGFQLQSPLAVAGMALMFTLIALNLFGMLELGAWLPSGIAGLRLKAPWADEALSGVLAVFVASPCTAPFMGAAMGAAASLPAMQALWLFAALGLGMAAPYLLLGLWPRAAAWLPRPGPWMPRLCTLLGFPMLGTVLWLLWVLASLTHADAVIALLATILLLACLVWALQAFRGSAARPWLAGGLIALTLAGGRWSLVEMSAAPGPAPSLQADARGGWRAWSAKAVEQARAQGRPVLVDFTAAWCVTCQVNKRTTLSDAGLLKSLQERNVLLLRADWTRRDPEIQQALLALGRNGVPAYAFYQPDQPKPRMLPELLSVNDVQAALEGLQNRDTSKAVAEATAVLPTSPPTSIPKDSP